MGPTFIGHNVRMSPFSRSRPFAQRRAALGAGEVISSGSPNLFEIATEDARTQGVGVDEHLTGIMLRAEYFIESDALVDRGDFMESLKQVLQAGRDLTLVLGGDNFGKSFVRDHAISELVNSPSCNTTVVMVDMRYDWQLPLPLALLKRAHALMDQKQNPGNVLNPWLSYTCQMLSKGFATTAAHYGLGNAAGLQHTAHGVDAFSSGLFALDMFIQRVREQGNYTCFVVDEAQLALPGTQTRDATLLQHIIFLTKQKRLANFVLISSDYGYPRVLQEAGLSPQNINGILLATEVARPQMMRLFEETWGMGPALATEFFKHYGGHIYLAYRSLQQLIRKGRAFYPLEMLSTIGLSSCVQDDEARPHLRNMAAKGFSPVWNVYSKGAQLLAKRRIGGLISLAAIVHGLPEGIWDCRCDYALIPTCHAMRLRIVEHLQSWDEEHPGS